MFENVIKTYGLYILAWFAQQESKANGLLFCVMKSFPVNSKLYKKSSHLGEQ